MIAGDQVAVTVATPHFPRANWVKSAAQVVKLCANLGSEVISMNYHAAP